MQGRKWYPVIFVGVITLISIFLYVNIQAATTPKEGKMVTPKAPLASGRIAPATATQNSVTRGEVAEFVVKTRGLVPVSETPIGYCTELVKAGVSKDLVAYPDKPADPAFIAATLEAVGRLTPEINQKGGDALGYFRKDRGVPIPDNITQQNWEDFKKDTTVNSILVVGAGTKSGNANPMPQGEVSIGPKGINIVPPPPGVVPIETPKPAGTPPPVDTSRLISIPPPTNTPTPPPPSTPPPSTIPPPTTTPPVITNPPTEPPTEPPPTKTEPPASFEPPGGGGPTTEPPIP